jgi:predicted amidohydrolase
MQEYTRNFSRETHMARPIIIAGAQLGGIARDEPRPRVVARLIALLRDAHAQGAQVVVFPELALTTFFPRWWMEDQAEIDSFFETSMPNAATQPLFDEAKKLGVAFYLGYAELTAENGRPRHYNTAILVDKTGAIVGKYRKVHLPGHADHRPHMPYQHLEKLYFDVPPDGFGVWDLAGGKFGMAICNDRRWPETYRVMALKGAEVVMLGYNTPTHIPWEPIYDHLSAFHNHLVMQAAGYQNSMYVVGVAKAGKEEGSNLLAGSCIVAPSGEIVAMAQTDGDEAFVARCDLDRCLHNRKAMFNFAEHRQVQHYQNITE